MKMNLTTDASGLWIWQLLGSIFLGYMIHLVIRFLQSSIRKKNNQEA